MENDKQFWKSEKPLFSNVDPTRVEIIFIEGDKILSRDEEVSACFNKYFSNITDSLENALNFMEVHEDVTVELTVDQVIEKAVEKYKNHPSIRRIRDNCDMANSKFEFTHVLPNEVGKQIDALNSNKANSGKIPTNKLKKAKDLACRYITDCVNAAIYESEFPKELKDADVSTVFKRGVATTKVNYRPISVLLSASKIFERILKGQMGGFFKPTLSSILSSFREGYSTQHSLVRVIEAWRRSLDLSGIVGTILMDLSEAYDCIPHDLLIVKFEAYGFHEKSLQLMYSYLANRKRSVKIGCYKSS